jgi:hypothetical protein
MYSMRISNVSQINTAVIIPVANVALALVLPRRYCRDIHMTARNVRPKHVDPSFTRSAPHIEASEITTVGFAMLDIEDFESAFPDGVTYTDGIVQGIQGFQHALGGKTFFERLLVLLKVQGMSNA